MSQCFNKKNYIDKSFQLLKLLNQGINSLWTFFIFLQLIYISTIFFWTEIENCSIAKTFFHKKIIPLNHQHFERNASYSTCDGGNTFTRAEQTMSWTRDNSNNESSRDKIQNYLLWAIAFSTKILTLATLVLVDTSEKIIFVALAALGGIAK